MTDTEPKEKRKAGRRQEPFLIIGLGVVVNVEHIPLDVPDSSNTK